MYIKKIYDYNYIKLDIRSKPTSDIVSMINQFPDSSFEILITGADNEGFMLGHPVSLQYSLELDENRKCQIYPI